jgi:hypothetical protein
VAFLAHHNHSFCWPAGGPSFEATRALPVRREALLLQ